jgi:hypothetical protein
MECSREQGSGIPSLGNISIPAKSDFSSELVRRIEKWVIDYETAHYRQFDDEAENQRLDREGIEIARQAQSQLPEMKVEYFSNAQMKKIRFK